MTALEDFENTLKEVVNAKRLSASKMNRLTEIAVKSLEDDTQLVAILYRTHKSLPDSAKVHSFQVNKYGATGDQTSEKGNAATFLLKIEGVLDGFPEAKEKTKKVLDIWVKSNTFPSTVLARLRDMLTDVQKDNVVNGTQNDARVDEAPANTTTPPSTAQTTTSPDVQSTLLTLLGQAAQLTSQSQNANVNQSQTPPNTELVTPQLGQAQLELLQQLTLTAKLGNAQTQPGLPPTQDAPLAGGPRLITNQVSEPAHSFPPTPGTPSQNQPGYNQENPRHERAGYPDRSRGRSNFHDERYSHRGGFRGGYRGGHRGRGRDRWDDRNNFDRFRQRERDWDAPPRPRRSRSRSPRRHEGRRDARPHSPPYRLSDEKYKPRSELPTPAPENGKDEFGRDIRPSSVSPPRSMSLDEVPTQTPVVPSVVPAPAAAPDYHIPVSDQLPSVAASTSAQSIETPTSSPATSQQQGLDQFNIATFDATAPSSWEALGNMWRITYGYPPSQEELMEFVMTSTSGSRWSFERPVWKTGRQSLATRTRRPKGHWSVARRKRARLCKRWTRGSYRQRQLPRWRGIR
ncbi:hypothetical protein F5I97DRAFT_1839159 [Phlebopus sp. FC_14]|nr:hypothetical protein F5I97DRAFT_1839159 [Phlebopus sp. FC_14]